MLNSSANNQKSSLKISNDVVDFNFLAPYFYKYLPPKTHKTDLKCIALAKGCSSTGNTRWALRAAHIPIY